MAQQERCEYDENEQGQQFRPVGRSTGTWTIAAFPVWMSQPTSGHALNFAMLTRSSFGLARPFSQNLYQ